MNYCEDEQKVISPFPPFILCFPPSVLPGFSFFLVFRRFARVGDGACP